MPLLGRSIFWLCLAIGLVSAQGTAAGEANWKAFLEWLNAQPPNSKPAELINPYRDKLLRDGLPQREVDRRMEMTWWGCRGNKPVFTEQPNALVISAVDGRRPGKALDFGMGQGRDALFLALQGWDNTGFDPAEGALRGCGMIAEKRTL